MRQLIKQLVIGLKAKKIERTAAAEAARQLEVETAKRRLAQKLARARKLAEQSKARQSWAPITRKQVPS